MQKKYVFTAFALASIVHSTPSIANRVALEEVVVTAQKRAENVQDVPISINALSGAELDARGISDPIKLQSVTPGLVYDSLASFAIIYLRGVGTDAFIPSADLSVATYIDDVYQPFSFGLAREFTPVERIEVIKGPQGTLFGRNATGGAINITTKQPGPEFYGDLQLSIGNYSEKKSRLYVSGPITETLYAGIGLIYNEKEDYYSLSSDSPLDELQPYVDKGISGSFVWEPVDKITIKLGGHIVESEGVGTSLFVQEAPSALGSALGLDDNEDSYVTSVDAASESFGESSMAYLNMTYRAKYFDIKSISAKQESKGQQLVDFDGTETNLVSFGGLGDEFEEGTFASIFTQEVQFLSNDEGWAADNNMEWVLGLYYLDSTAGFNPVGFNVAGLDDLFSGGALDAVNILGLGDVIDLLSPALDPLFDALSGAGLSGFGGGLQLTGKIDTESYAAFFQSTWAPKEWLSVTIGARYQEEKRSVYDAVTNVRGNTGSGDAALIPLFTFAEKNLEENNFSPKVSIGWTPNDYVMMYASWQRAFKSGSFNIINIYSEPAEILPETVEAFEIGFKSDVFSNTLRLNGAIFQTEITDLQSQFLSLLSGGVVQFQNAQKAMIEGAELSAVWAATDNLIFNLATMYLDGVYDEFTGASGFDPESGLLTSDNDYSGNKIVRNPEWTTSAGVFYTYNFDESALEFGLDYYYNDGYFYSAQNSAKQEPYELWNARVAYFYEPWDVRITGYVDNITDEERHLFQFETDFGTVGKLAAPTTYGAKINWYF